MSRHAKRGCVFACATETAITAPTTDTAADDTTGTAVVALAVTATDDITPAADLTITGTLSDGDGEIDPSGHSFPVGTTAGSCTATDEAGNVSPAFPFTLVVLDKTTPTLTFPTPPFIVEATSPASTVVTFAQAVSATDAVTLVPTITCLPASGTPFATGSHPVSCTARDAAGNVSPAKTFDVRVDRCIWSGWLSPINRVEDNVVTATHTLPIKWSMSGNYGTTGMFATGYPKLVPLAGCDANSAVDTDVSELAAPSEGL
ncbi:hypothetical protein HYH03_007892 [Edaphochlamys debaryana]|uniref:HYR domain-containing protein n=1 Tax=Edaphochlamys debaryana TaxID=47281 RepID=A0A836BZH9_9CHLO|nr:hypothetical protein HYH03_007892 [Edaphochlamys debaryana]|eukprot:KAG2493962.1 hypothetical protein HYH03_007892 [Edaphochlamys debaryana]